MFIDAQTQFHDDTAVTSAGEYKGDSMPLETVATMVRENQGEPLEAIIQVTEDFAEGTNCKFELITADVAALTNDVAQGGTPVVVTAQLVAGAKFRIPLAMSVADVDGAFFGVMATSVGTHTAGTFSAWVQRAGEDQNSY